MHVRAWIRGAARQPLRGAVVTLTLVLMTIGTCGALLAAASLERLFVADAHAEWGEVDVEVTSVEDGIIELPSAREVGLEAASLARAAAPRLVLRAVVESSARSERDVHVLGIGAEDQRFAPLAAVAGQGEVLQLARGEVAVNERLADRLDLTVGDPVTVHVAVPRTLERGPTGGIDRIRPEASVPLEVTVAGIVADTGVADLHRTPNVLLRRDILQHELDFGPFVNVVHLAAAGDTPEDTIALSRGIESYVRTFDLESETVLLDQLVIAEDEGGQFQAILFTLATLVLVAAGIAVAQMLTALAEDRSDEVALLRVLGTPPTVIARLVGLESGVYALVGTVIGAAAAVPLGAWLADALASHFADLAAGRGREQVALPTDVDLGWLAAGALLVLVVAVVTGYRTGARLGTTSLDRLLRGPLEHLRAASLSRRRPHVLGAAGWLLLGMGLAGGPASDATRYLGITLLGLAWWTWRRRRVDDVARLDDRVAAAGLVWATLGALALADFSQGFEVGFGIMVAAGLVAVGAVTGWTTRRFRRLMGIVRTVAPRGAWQVCLRTVGAWAQEAAGRTSRLQTTFGMVMFLVASLHVLGSAMAVPVASQSGGFDVLATTVTELDPTHLDQQTPGNVVGLYSLMIAEDDYGAQAHPEDPLLRLRYPVRLAAATPELAATQEFRLAAALPAYATAQEALTAAAVDHDKVVVDRYGLPPGAEVGDDIVVDIGPAPRRFQLIAVLDTFLLDTAFVNLAELHSLVPSVGTNLFLAHADTDGPDALADGMAAANVAAGMDADTMTEIATDVVDVNRTFTDVFALIVLLGLGVAVVAVVASQVRTTQQRHGTLASLAAIGVPRWAIVAAVAIEPVAVSLVGAVIGLAVGLGVLRLLFLAGFSQMAFVVDLGQLVVALGTVIGGLLLLAVLTASTMVGRRGRALSLHD